MTLTTREGRMLQGVVDVVVPMDILLITAEKRYEMKKSRNCRVKPQPRKMLRSPRTRTKDVDLPTALEIRLDGTMIMGLWRKPHEHLLEENSGQVIRILTTSDKIDLSSDETTRITTISDTMTRERDHNISRISINIGVGEVTITIHDHLQRHDEIHPSRIFGDNPDQIHLILQFLTGLEIEIRATINPSTRNSQLPTMVISQT